MRPSILVVNERDRRTLERWIRAPTTPQRTALRSRLILLLDHGLSARAVARELGVSRHTVDLWRERYLKEGCLTLTRDRPGRGRRPSRPDEPPADEHGRSLSAQDRSS